MTKGLRYSNRHSDGFDRFSDCGVGIGINDLLDAGGCLTSWARRSLMLPVSHI